MPTDGQSWGKSALGPVTYTVPRPRGPVRSSATLCGSQERVAKSGRSPACKPGATLKLRRPRVPAPIPAGYLRRSSGGRWEGQRTVHGGGLADLPVLDFPPAGSPAPAPFTPAMPAGSSPPQKTRPGEGSQRREHKVPFIGILKTARREEGLPPPEIASSSLPSGLRGGTRLSVLRAPRGQRSRAGEGWGKGNPRPGWGGGGWNGKGDVHPHLSPETWCGPRTLGRAGRRLMQQ